MLLKWLLLISISQVFAEDSWSMPGCQLRGNTRTYSIPGCLPYNITTNGCRGHCESWSIPSAMRNDIYTHPVTSLGQCCNIMETEDVTFQVKCTDGEHDIVLKSAVSCACYHCLKG